MKYSVLLLLALSLVSCSDDETTGPWNLKNGQEVDLMIGHDYGSVSDEIVLLPQNKVANISLYGFADREPGYNYRVKARMVIEKNPPQDGSAYHFEFVDVVSKEKYEGNDSFEIALIQSPGFSGPVITLVKQDDRYFFVSDKLRLRYESDEVEEQLEEIWQNASYIRDTWQSSGIQSEIKWKAIRATVTHDPANFGKAYLVHHIEFTE